MTNTSFSSDRTGFPLVDVPPLGLKVHLLPVTKVQFEMFIAEPNEFDDSWYEEVLAKNPRVSYLNFREEDRERLFITRLKWEEAKRFAAWMTAGNGKRRGISYDLPTAAEWRKVYDYFLRLNAPTLGQDGFPPQGSSEQSIRIIRRLIRQLRPSTLADLSLMKGGILEWVKDRQKHVGIGKPSDHFYQSAWDLCEEPVDPPASIERPDYMGFRLVCRNVDE